MVRKEGNRPSNLVQRPATPPGVSFGQHGPSYNQSPPRTHPFQYPVACTGKSKGASGIKAPRNRPALRDAFGDQVREAERDHTRNRSNSHELSWTPNRNTRASVVDNMLASLDQFSTTTSSRSLSSNTRTTTTTSISHSNGNDPFYSTQHFISQPTGRSRSHTISSSVSSDYSFHADLPKSRGHRSNSSTNFQSSLGRIDSVRLTNEAEERVGRTRNDTATAKPPTLHGGGRKGSKSSGSSSIDFGAMAQSSRWQRSTDRRSSSFDHGYARPAFAPPAATSSSSPLNVGQQEALFYDSLDAAPTPTVPAGPRRNDSRNASPAPSASFRPGSALSAPHPASMRRRGSIRSPMAIFHRPDRSEALEPGDPEKQIVPQLGRDDNLFNTTPNDSTQTPENEPGTSVHNQTASASNSAGVAKEKERPGFFKRVFGSARNYPPTPPHEYTPSHSKNPSSQNNMIIASSRNENTPPNGQSRRTARPAQGAALQKAPIGEKSLPKDLPPHPPLNKKTSFFRRRKKSVSETSAIPVPPLQLQPQWQNQPLPIDQSPVSSLRQVMDPYLNGPVGIRPGSAGTAQAILEQERHRRGDYFGPPTIRAVHKQSDSATIVLPPSGRSIDHPSDNEELRTTVSGHSAATEPSRRPPPPPKVDNQPTDKARDVKQSKDSAPAGSAKPKKAERSVPSPVKTQLPRRTSSSDWKDTQGTNKDVSEHIMPKASPRLWIAPDDSDEETESKKLPAPPKSPVVTDPKASVSTLNSDYQSANSKQQSPTEATARTTKYAIANIANQQSSEDNSPEESPSHQLQSTEVDELEPTEDDLLAAAKLFTGESPMRMADIAAWLGEAGVDQARVRKAYMDIFDWHHMSILAALRSFCSQLRLKGESQQVDRLLDSLAKKWCHCNPDHGFKAADVVHTICYSLILLNTDLHLADIEQKMTRSQFIRNTMPTIRRVVTDAAPDAFPTARASMLPPPKPSQDDYYHPLDSPGLGSSGRPTNRLTTRPSDHSGRDTPADSEGANDDCGPLVRQPFNGRQSAWEAQVEVVLKNFYNSIRQERLPLVRTEEPRRVEPQQSTTSLSAATGGFLRRSNSMLSKAGSESLPARGRAMDSRMGSRFSSKPRSRPRLYQASLGRASRTSLEDDMSTISPSASSMWSKYSLGKTQTSMSVNSYTSDYPPRGDYQRSIGFANALSQAIIREDASGDAQEETMRVVPLLEDESLELAGAPWAKEGMLKHKHHLESVDKKAKDRNWNECFAVIDKGWMRLFSFNINARSMRQKARNQKVAGTVVGGGNWTENAESMGKFSLRQTIASALPPPGYSRARPHVFALSLPNGAVHLFQAGTPEIVREHVSAANYWSARMSKEPLVGGVSNVEYGWSDAVINLALLDNRPPSAMTGPRPSLQNSIRSSIDQTNSRPKLPGDRILITDWTPPTVSMMESQLLEVDQLRALSNYVKNIEEELSKHNELRPAIALAFSPRHPNAQKAMNNWERKSSYLLREIVKFRTYIDSLQQAQTLKEKIYKEREEHEKELQKFREADTNTGVSKGKEVEAA